MGKTLKTKQELLFCKKHLHLEGKALFVRISPPPQQEEEDVQASRNSHHWRRQDFNLHKNLTQSPPKTDSPHPQHPLLSLAEGGR